MKRYISLFLIMCVALAALSGCSNEISEIPDGMQLIDSEFVDYYFYVPDDWLVVSDESFLHAENQSDSSNVSIQGLSLSQYDFTSANDYWQRHYRDEMLSELQGMNIAYIDEGSETTMGGLEAIRTVYTLTTGGEDYKLLQVIAVETNATYVQTVYIFTYTALADCYDDHIDDVFDMIDYFEFK